MFRKFFFNLWYFREPPWDTGISPPELLDFLDNHEPGSALDLGCGTGTNAITLAKHGWQVTGVDFARQAINRAQKKARLAGLDIQFILDDVSQIRSIDASFELILDIGCLHGLPEEAKNRYIRNIKRLLAPGGTYLMYAFLRDGGESGSGLDEYNIDQLSTTLHLQDRQEGTERGERPSAWFTFKQLVRVE